MHSIENRLNVEDYLRRIGLHYKPDPDLAGLKAVHRAHILSIPYENIDVQLGRTLTTNPKEAWAKIVGRGRGGWCYEMNGLLGAALSELGFKVTRLAGAVMREEHWERALNNHLVLKVDLPEGAYLADVGFGEGAIDPVPLAPCEVISNGFRFALTRENDIWWRYHKYLPHARRSYDFTLLPADEGLFAERCTELQTASDSLFVLNLLCYKHFEGGYSNLLGRVLKKVKSTDSVDRTEIDERLIEDANDLVTTLKETFTLDVPDAASLWPRIVARHEEVFNQKNS